MFAMATPGHYCTKDHNCTNFNPCTYDHLCTNGHHCTNGYHFTNGHNEFQCVSLIFLFFSLLSRYHHDFLLLIINCIALQTFAMATNGHHCTKDHNCTNCNLCTNDHLCTNGHHCTTGYHCTNSHNEFQCVSLTFSCISLIPKYYNDFLLIAINFIAL